MFGLIIVDDDQFTSGSKQISLRQSMKRYFAFLIPIVTIVGLYFLPFLLIAIGFKKRKRGYHDEIANTVVIYKNSYSSFQDKEI